MELKRELGLFSVCSIACGAMLSGLFVLPGHAYEIGGPSIYLAFLLAGLLFVPAALSKAEMATALPESGGDYVFIDRSLGPLISTITGLGTWLALVLKSAFALVGLSTYLLVFLPLSGSYALLVAVGIALLLIGFNCIGAEKAGLLQSVLVVISIGVLLILVDRGSVATHPDYYRPLLPEGTWGFIQATAFVFVSYAGVTKVASAAEEVKNPGQNIPRGILISLVLMAALYTLVVHVYVGLVPPGAHGEQAPILYRNAPLAQATAAFLGTWGERIISVVAVGALASMANAGLLASSRYPLAMARYDQLPEQFARINSWLSTPVTAIVFTGGLIVFSILFLPVVQLAKLASGFLLLIFGILNFSVIIFRESDIEWYNPEFRAPLYPHLQFAGLLISVSLILCLGSVAVISAAGLSLIGTIWYYFYVSNRVSRDSTLSRSSTGKVTNSEFTTSETALMEERLPNPVVLVPFFNLNQDQVLRAQNRIEVAFDLFKSSHRIKVLNVHETADASFLPNIRQPDTIDRALKRYSTRLNRQGGSHVDFNRIVTTHSHDFVHQYVNEKKVEWTLLNWKSSPQWGFLVSNGASWLSRFPGNVLLVKEGDTDRISRVQSLVKPFPGSDQAFVVRTTNSMDPARSNKTRVDFFSLNSSKPGFTEREKQLSEYYRNQTGRSVKTTRISGYEKLGDRITGSNSDELFVVDEFAAGAIDYVSPDHLSCTLVRPVYSAADRLDESKNMERLAGLLSTDDLYLQTWKPLSKRSLFHELAKRLADEITSANVIEKSLWITEKNYETYVANGVAIPHAIVPDGPVRGSLHTLERSVEYSREGENVELCIPVIGGESRASKVFEMVATIDSLSRNASLIDELKRAEIPAEILKQLRNHDPTTTLV